MPRTKRQEVLLKHDQILRAIEKAVQYTAVLHDMFSVPHPDYAEGYKNIIMMLAQAHEFVEKMKGFV